MSDLFAAATAYWTDGVIPTDLAMAVQAQGWDLDYFIEFIQGN